MRDSDGNIIPSGLLKYDKASKISFKNHRKHEPSAYQWKYSFINVCQHGRSFDSHYLWDQSHCRLHCRSCKMLNK